MPKFFLTGRCTASGASIREFITADDKDDAKLEFKVRNIYVQVLSCRQCGAPEVTAPAAPKWESTKTVKNRLAMHQAREQETEAKMLGEDFDLRAAYLDNRGKLG